MENDSIVNSLENRDSEPKTLPSVCVVICTRDRPNQLRRTLVSLQVQKQSPEEILVVDNAPSDEQTKALVTQEFSGVRYVRESLQGLNFARNRGLAETSQDIVAFIDDDAVAEPDWVEYIQKMFFSVPSSGSVYWANYPPCP